MPTYFELCYLACNNIIILSSKHYINKLINVSPLSIFYTGRLLYINIGVSVVLRATTTDVYDRRHCHYCQSSTVFWSRYKHSTISTANNEWTDGEHEIQHDDEPTHIGVVVIHMLREGGVVGQTREACIIFYCTRF